MSYFSTKDEARRAGRLFLPQVRAAFGKGWQVEVWENLGWHVVIRHAHIRIMIDNHWPRMRFWAMISADAESSAGVARWCKTHRARTPEGAVRAAMRHMRAAVKAEIKLVCAIEDSILASATKQEQKGKRAWLKPPKVRT